MPDARLYWASGAGRQPAAPARRLVVRPIPLVQDPLQRRNVRPRIQQALALLEDLLLQRGRLDLVELGDQGADAARVLATRLGEGRVHGLGIFVLLPWARSQYSRTNSLMSVSKVRTYLW